MNPNPLAKKLNEFLYQADADEIFQAVTNHKLKDGGIVKALNPDTQILRINPNGISAEDYISLLDCNSYSAVFRDGAILIIQATFTGNTLSSHRYIYIPCPIERQYFSTLLTDEPLADLVRDIISDAGVKAVRSAGYVRFDYKTPEEDPKEPHPISHMTFCSGECRMPVHSPLSIAGFLNFIFDNFYRSDREFWSKFSAFLTSPNIDETITNEEKDLYHINCSHPTRNTS